MPRTLLATQDIPFEGNAALTFNAADQANGMKFVADGRTALIVKNGSGATRTVTLTDVADTKGRRAPSSKTSISVAAGAERWIGPLPSEGWTQPTGNDQGTVLVDIDSATSVTIAVPRFNQQ